jgi:adenosyl cobinamide kinase/adenosyl cobinamide phosphate guanylyltransferase
VITFVLGGSRSGKSAVAERLALTNEGRVRYLATGWADPGDLDMAERIERHRAARSDRFDTVEAGTDLVGALSAEPAAAVRVDALGTWVARHHDFVVPIDELVAALSSRTAPTVVVSDEVGLGVHPETPVGRQFRDALGTVTQRIAGVASTSYLVVAGRAITLSDPP